MAVSFIDDGRNLRAVLVAAYQRLKRPPVAQSPEDLISHWLLSAGAKTDTAGVRPLEAAIGCLICPSEAAQHGQLVAAAARAVAQRQPPGCPEEACRHRANLNVQRPWQTEYLLTDRRFDVDKRWMYYLAAWTFAECTFFRDTRRAWASRPQPQWWGEKDSDPQDLGPWVKSATEETSKLRKLRLDFTRYCIAGREAAGAFDQDHTQFGVYLAELDPDGGDSYERSLDRDRVPRKVPALLQEAVEGGPNFPALALFLHMLVVETLGLDPEAPPSSGAAAVAKERALNNLNEIDERLEGGLAAYELCDRINDEAGSTKRIVHTFLQEACTAVRNAQLDPIEWQEALFAQLERLQSHSEYAVHATEALEHAVSFFESKSPKWTSWNLGVWLAGLLSILLRYRRWFLLPVTALFMLALWMPFKELEVPGPHGVRVKGGLHEAEVMIDGHACSAVRKQRDSVTPCSWSPKKDRLDVYYRKEKYSNAEKLIVLTWDAEQDWTKLDDLDLEATTHRPECPSGWCSVLGGWFDAPVGALELSVVFGPPSLTEAEAKARILQDRLLRKSVPGVYRFSIDVR